MQRDTFFTRIIRTSINNLAGVPSIVFGLFGLGFFILFIGKGLDDVLQTGLLFGQPALLWASATLAVLVLPIVIVSTLEALNSVPKSHRDASYGLGATKWQTIKNVVLPQARPGILTGTILAISRGAGETAPILFLGAAFFLTQSSNRRYLHWRILYPYDQSNRTVYVSGLSYFYYGNTVVKSNKNITNTIWFNLGINCFNILSEYYCNNFQISF